MSTDRGNTLADGKIRLAFVNADHLHFGGLMRAALEVPWAEVVGMVVDDEELRAWAHGQFPSVPLFEASDELYDKAKPQAIATCADNLNALDVVTEAAEHGVHVMKEKPMAASLDVAEEMLVATSRAGVRLMINWATNWQPAFHYAKQLVDEGQIGQVWQVYNRSGHGGPPADYQKRGPVARIGWGWLMDRERNGAGAYVDFCSYGAVVSRWFMGQPSRVYAMGGRYVQQHFAVEDNAVLLMGYPHGHSIAEGTWSTPTTPVRIPTLIYGSKGTIAIAGDKVQIATLTDDPRNPKQETLTAPAMPDHYKSGPAYFTYCILHDQPFEGIVNPQISRDSQEILEAGLYSMEEGEEIGLPLKSFLG